MLLIAGIGSVGAVGEAVGVWRKEVRATKWGTGAQFASVVTLLALTAMGAHQSEAPGGAMFAGAGALGCAAYPLARHYNKIGDGGDGLARTGLELTGLFFSVVAAQSHGHAAAWVLPVCAATPLFARWYFAN